MTRIKPTVSLFRVWQRELDRVLAHFSTTYTFSTVVMRLLSHGPHVTLVMWHTVTVTCDVTICHTIVTLWQSHVMLSHTPPCSCKSKKRKVSQTSFGHISINSLSILTVSMATESPWKDLSIGTSHVSRRSVTAEILGRSTGNHHGTVY